MRASVVRAHGAQADDSGAEDSRHGVSVSAEVRAEVSRLSVAWRTASEQIDRYRGAIMPRSSAAFDATRSSYLAGRGDFVAVLDEFRRWVEVRVELARREADRYVAAVGLKALRGEWSGLGTQVAEGSR